MDALFVKTKIEELLSEYKQKFEKIGLTVKTEITAEDDKLEECSADSKKITFVTGYIWLLSDGTTEDDAPGQGISIYFKKGRAKEEEFVKSVEEIKSELDAWVERLSSCESVSREVKALSEECSKEAEESVAELEKTMKKIKLVTNVLAAAAGMLFVLAIILMFFVK